MWGLFYVFSRILVEEVLFMIFSSSSSPVCCYLFWSCFYCWSVGVCMILCFVRWVNNPCKMYASFVVVFYFFIPLTNTRLGFFFIPLALALAWNSSKYSHYFTRANLLHLHSTPVSQKTKKMQPASRPRFQARPASEWHNFPLSTFHARSTWIFHMPSAHSPTRR